MSELNSVELTIVALILLLLMTMLAFVLRALSRPITVLIAGDALPLSVAEWSTRGRLRGGCPRAMGKVVIERLTVAGPASAVPEKAADQVTFSG